MNNTLNQAHHEQEMKSRYSSINRKERGIKPKTKFLVYERADTVIMKSSSYLT